MTKVTILGEKQPKKTKKKAIQFIYDTACSKSDTCFQQSEMKPSDYDKVELIARALSEAYYDIMFAYDDGDRSGGAIFLGHFNDGIV